MRDLNRCDAYEGNPINRIILEDLAPYRCDLSQFRNPVIIFIYADVTLMQPIRS